MNWLTYMFEVKRSKVKVTAKLSDEDILNDGNSFRPSHTWLC